VYKAAPLIGGGVQWLPNWEVVQIGALPIARRITSVVNDRVYESYYVSSDQIHITVQLLDGEVL